MLYLQLQLCLFLMCMNAIHVFAAWSTLRLGTQYLHTLSVYYTLCSAAIPTSAHSESLVDTEIYTFFATAKAHVKTYVHPLLEFPAVSDATVWQNPIKA